MNQAPPHAPMGPPYPPTTAGLGGMPTTTVDVPITSVLLALFIIGAACNMTIFQINRKRGHKFLMSAILFGFCMARVATLVMRIVWACYPRNLRIGMAAMILVSAGVLLLFLINIIFAQRILRAAHPHFGWHKALSISLKVIYALILVVLAMVITATVQSFYTLNTNTKRIDRDIQLAAGTYLMVISFLPIPMVLIGLALPRHTSLDKFGTGRWRTKVWILLTASVLLCLGASFRTGTTYKTPRPGNNPAWYQATWCFYVFNFVIELIVVYLYIFLRVDRRFHVPNGSKGPGSYSPRARINSEEEVFDDESVPEELHKDEENRG